MNVTDIDDKIIRRARRAHLFSRYIDEKRSLSNLISDVSSAIEVIISVGNSHDVVSCV